MASAFNLHWLKLHRVGPCTYNDLSQAGSETAPEEIQRITQSANEEDFADN
jgi:hypothetical protein